MDQSARVRAVLAERNIRRQDLGAAIGVSRRRIYGLLACHQGCYWRAEERTAAATYLGLPESALFPRPAAVA